MIIVDTNTIAYLYLPSDFTTDVEDTLKKDSHWAAPFLWRSELRNILAVYMRRDLLSLNDAIEIQEKAEKLLSGNEYEINSNRVIQLAKESGCSAYDCEFVSLAKSTDCKLVTEDKKVIRTFPTIAMNAKTFLGQY